MITKGNDHVVGNIQKYFLLLALVTLLVTLFIFVEAFWTDMLFAGVIVTGIFPLHRLISQKTKMPGSLSAFITMLLTLVLIITPFTIFFFFLANEATDAYLTISSRVSEWVAGDIRLLPEILRDSFVGAWFEKIKGYVPISAEDIFLAITEMVRGISTILISGSKYIITRIPIVLIHAVIFILMIFYFIKDGERLIEYLKSLLPLSAQYRKEVFSKLHKLSYAIIYGIFGAAIAQGLLVGIGFAIADINNAAFWGSVAALFSPLPYIGVSVVWVPAMIFLFITNQWFGAVFLLIWCMAIVSFADNIIKPYIMGSSASIHPLAVLLVLIGGVFAFGIRGLFFGPLILTLALTFLHIYKLEYKSILDDSRQKKME